MNKLKLIGLAVALSGCQVVGNSVDVEDVAQSRRYEHSASVTQFSDHLDQFFTQSVRDNVLDSVIRLLESSGSSVSQGQDRQTGAAWFLNVGETEWQAIEVKRPTIETVSAEYDYIFRDIPYRATTQVNLRSGPGTEYARLRQLRRGEVFTVMAQVFASDWYLIEQAGIVQGYVHSDYATANVTSRDLLNARPNPLVLDGVVAPELPVYGYLGLLTCRSLSYRFNNESLLQEGGFVACQKQPGVWYIDAIVEPKNDQIYTQ
uniref:SH3 domain-containing protein n=1 Tax=Thaumasiovibrio occultus TaxID=1891184 RepID=UPI000B354713|nr:SH3 domain-containing protein [Thaumasiovibrio occultus]